MNVVPSSARDRARQYAQDASGVAAVEFSLILPVALLMMALVVYGGQAFRIQRKVELSAATVANLVAQGDNTSVASVTSAEMTQILAYPNLILYPNDASAVQVVVSELSVSSVNGVATGTVVGSWANANAIANEKLRPCNQQLPINSNIVCRLYRRQRTNFLYQQPRRLCHPRRDFLSIQSLRPLRFSRAANVA